MAQPITRLLETFITQPADWRSHLVRNWQTIVGALHTRMCLEKIGEDGTLLLGVHDSRWMQELFYLTPTIMQTINTYFNHTYITRIRFILSRTEHNPYKHRPKGNNSTDCSTARGAEKPLRSLTTAEQLALRRVDDPQLQQILRQIMQKQ